MIGKIKEAIQGRLYRRCIEEYERELRCQTDPYLLWIRENEKGSQKEEREGQYPEIGIVYMQNCGRNFSLSGVDKKYILFVSKNGRIAPNALGEITQYFETHQDVNVVYTDEDTWMLELDKVRRKDLEDDESTHRIFPWTKPEWSPDTLFSFLYFGNIFAVRREACLGIEWLGDGDYRKNVYDFALKATEDGRQPGHIEKILFHSYEKGGNRIAIEERLMHRTDLIGVGEEYDDIRENALARRGLHGRMAVDEQTGISYPVYEVPEKPLVSIVIPSKDNPDVLRQCIRSVYAHTDYSNFEIVVVDNGSAEGVRGELENFRKECPFTYLYQPMDFNFSHMCNVGVEESKGEYILLLNDDMEVIEDFWLTRMVGQASLKHVGSVGAKLLYPNSTMIQHAGVNNTVSGPGHKLKQLDDSVSYYYGRNRLVYDMIGVTGACLMIRRECYLAMGGLYEGLAVAYNDVDLCFRLYSKGLYNVQRNDVVLYHHESLSRGDDLKDERKRKRLNDEKKLLYKRHPKLYRHDPFLGILLNNGEPEYSCGWLEQYELFPVFDVADERMIAESGKLPAPENMNQAILIVVEDCGKEEFSKAVTENGHKTKTYYLVKGWAYVPGADNARYQFKILLVNGSGKVWELPVQKRYRRDVAAILPDETNVALAGFCNWIVEGTLPPDTYALWMTAKDGCSRQRLYRSMEKTLTIE
ncbi:MAG: glycosyltransferase family 2 protein [Lachnospiraceae bacterium]|nr:glycosyltransferase family 2 protein [Lachnospiraceae bacterium]